jgi:hypothetical protein
MRSAALIVATVVLAAVSSSVLARCDPTVEPDLSDVANGRAAVAANCPCDLGTHREYVRCALTQAKAVVVNPSCVRAVKSCASRSVCGKPTAVTCCRTNSKGVTKCKVKRDAESCKPPRNGSACIGGYISCCDACTASGCAPTTTTITTTTTTITGSTTTIPVTLSGDVQPIFTNSCAVAFCHTPPFAPQNLDLTTGQSWSETVNVASEQCPAYKLVAPGDPASSYLMFKLQGSGPCYLGQQMPVGSPPLTAAEIQTISDWITQGAQNN